jgi:hypothetical protein
VRISDAIRVVGLTGFGPPGLWHSRRIAKEFGVEIWSPSLLWLFLQPNPAASYNG